MRDIKYRAFNYGRFRYIASNYDLSYWACSGAEGEECSLSEMKFEQFVGLTDNDGVEIYEGDIIFAKGVNAEIKFYHGCWMAFSSASCYFNLYYYKNRCKVIGNIHQNPELLNES